MLNNTMIETYTKNNHPSHQENQNSGLKMVIFPLIGFILLAIITAILLFPKISSGQQSLSNWVNISIIFVSLLLFIPGLLFLIIIFGLIKIINKSRPPIYSGLRKARQFVFTASNILTNVATVFLKPIFFLESALVILHRPKHK